jgi:orotidine-5'-phosphate decarboxylase
MTNQPQDRLVVALDTDDLGAARRLVERLAGRIGAFKIGKEFFTRFGPEGVARVLQGQPFFLDLKFHDIPNTVAGAIRSALAMRPFMLNVHASGGPAMLEAAAAALANAKPRPLLIGVTVLTSMDDGDLAAVGQQGPVEAQVLRLARLAERCGLDGVVAGPREAAALRRALGPAFTLVVPGSRPTWSAAGDQKRVLTPAEAVAAGADYLVIGRPVNAAADPAAAARRIVEELDEATAKT